MGDDVVLNKCEIIERCLKRIREIYDNKPDNLFKDQLRQDAIFLNLERACQAAISLAMRLIRIKNLGLPKESREAFKILKENSIVPRDLAASLQSMVGFRNLAVHEYQKINLDVVQGIITKRLDVFERFVEIALNLTK